MNETNYHHGNEGPEHASVHYDPRPYWKRAHHDWRFWIGMFLMLSALTVFVLSDNLAFLPWMPPPMPSTTGK
jgi:hypothetical protein